MLQEYIKFDEALTNGVLVVPAKDDLDMKSLRDYCKQNDIKYDELTNKEMEKFIIKKSKEKIS